MTIRELKNTEGGRYTVFPGSMLSVLNLELTKPCFGKDCGPILETTGFPRPGADGNH